MKIVSDGIKIINIGVGLVNSYLIGLKDFVVVKMYYVLKSILKGKIYKFVLKVYMFGNNYVMKLIIVLNENLSLKLVMDKVMVI